MDPAAIPNQVMDLTRTYGQVLIATFIGTALWGMTCMQTLMYFVTYESDRWFLKSLVVALWVLDTVHEVVCIQGLWQNLIPRFGDLVNISMVHPVFALEPLFTGIVALMAQFFFAWRIWSFTNKNWLYPMALFPLIVGQFVGFCIAVARELNTSLSFLDSQTHNRPLMLGVNSVVAGTDIIIAVTMSLLLVQGRTGYIEPERAILRVLNASVSTGACAAVVALIAIILAASLPGTLFYSLGTIPLCALYCNTVLANLNSRRFIRGTKSVDIKSGGRSIPISTLAAPHLSSRTESTDGDGRQDMDLEAKHPEFHGPAIAVQVETSKTTGYD